MAERLEDVYELEGELGRGAFGAVLRGRRRRDGVAVAVKRPLRPPAPQEAARIEREARLFMRVDHPRLARLLDVFPDAEGRLALVYELVPGQTLEARLAAGAPGPAAGLELLAGLAEGIDALHGAGLVHRDLKPANVMMGPDGPKLIDFGLARAAAGGDTVTATGVVMGTPLYLAPEQLGSGKVGPAADRYAFAVLAFEVLAGQAPFDGSPAEIMTAHLRAEPPRISRLRPGLAAGLDPVFARALAKEPGARFPSAVAFVEALGAGAGGTPRERVSSRTMVLPDKEVERTVRWSPPETGPPAGGRSPGPPPVGAPALPGTPPGRGGPASPGDARKARVPVLGFVGLALLAGTLYAILAPPPAPPPAGRWSAPTGGAPEPDPDSPPDPDPAPVRLARFMDGVAEDELIQALLGLPGTVRSIDAREGWEAARRAFSNRYRHHRVGTLLEELATQPVAPGWAGLVFRLDQVVGALSWFTRMNVNPGHPLYRTEARVDPDHAFEPVLADPVDRARLARVLGRLLRVRRSPGLDSYATGLEARRRELTRPEGLDPRFLWVAEVPRLAEDQVLDRCRAQFEAAGAGIRLVRGPRNLSPGHGPTLRMVDFLGAKCKLVDEEMGTGLGTDGTTPILAEHPVAPPGARDLVLGVVLNNINNQVRGSHLLLSLTSSGGGPTTTVSFRPPPPLAPGFERWLPAGEAREKRVALLVRIRREALPERVDSIGIQGASLQATIDHAEKVVVRSLVQQIAGPLPAAVDGAWDADPVAPEPTDEPCEVLDRLWRAISSEPALVAALSLNGSRAPGGEAEAVFDAGRAALARWGPRLAAAVKALGAGPVDRACHSDLAWLHLVERVLRVHRDRGSVRVFEPDRDPGLEAAVGRGVEVEVLPALGGRTDPGGGGAAAAAGEAAFLVEERGRGRVWTVLRSTKELPRKPYLRVLSPLGHPHEAPLAALGGVGSLLEGSQVSQAMVGDMPTAIRLGLEPAGPGPLVLALALTDWNHKLPAQVLRLMLKGAEGAVETTLVPPLADKGRRTGETEASYEIVGLRVAFRPELVPAGPLELVLTGHALQPIGDEAIAANVHGIFRLASRP